MTCETIKSQLVAYRDGELSEQERGSVAAHLSTCPTCTREEAQLARVSQLLSTMERVTPSADFAASFWQRLEREEQALQPELESHAPHWWHALGEWLTEWRLVPAFAAAASVLVFFGFLLSGRLTITPTPPAQPTTQVAGDVPAQVVKEPGLFVNYRVIADLNRLSHFDEIAAVALPGERDVEVASEDALPPALLKDPGFFVNYPILQRMDRLENLEAVLELPSEGNEHARG
jgi:negative regulator of sigma E activity